MTAQIAEGFPAPSRVMAGEIRAELARRGLTSRQFAKAHGFNEMWLNRRIGRKASIDMTLEEVSRIAVALDLDPRDLLVLLPRLDSNQQPSDYPHEVAA